MWSPTAYFWGPDRGHRQERRAVGQAEHARVGEMVHPRRVGAAAATPLPGSEQPLHFLLGRCGARRLISGGRIAVIDKNAEQWGKLNTPEWEKWFTRAELERLLRRHCREVSSRYISYWEDVEPDGLFLGAGSRSSTRTPSSGAS